jgi:enoyl-CoA hydratase/carnithine racemase
MQVLTVNELLSRVGDPNGTGQAQPAVVVKVDHPIDDALRKRLQWLSVPAIAITPKASELGDLSCFDMVVSNQDSAAGLFARIERRPLSSALLVSCVRSCLSLPVQQALATESLGYSTLQQGAEYLGWLRSRPTPRLSEVPEPLIIERREAVLKVTLNSPDNRNALSVAMRDALAELFELAIVDDSIKTVQVRGNGPAFCAGGDLKEFGLSKDPAMAHRVRLQRMPGRFVAMAPEKFHFHLHGACMGAGIEIPAFAQRVTATADAVFKLPEVGFGLIPGAGGCVSIPRRIGVHRMNQLAISGDTIDASTALAWGLIDEINAASHR